MKAYAKDFYLSQSWRDCREGYIKYRHGLCERCLQAGLIVPGVIVHHKTPITEYNINNSDITLDWSNLMLLCRNCHAAMHNKGRNRRFVVDEFGRVNSIPDK